jgi:hypothetical protein
VLALKIVVEFKFKGGGLKRGGSLKEEGVIIKGGKRGGRG